MTKLKNYQKTRGIRENQQGDKLSRKLSWKDKISILQSLEISMMTHHRMIISNRKMKRNQNRKRMMMTKKKKSILKMMRLLK